MSGGRNLLLLSALAAAGCTSSHQIQVRAIPAPGATSKTGNSLLGQARGQLALGDVGLALESLRILQREEPEDPAVFEAIAQCYAAMSRYDLVRTNLEFALAYAPNDPHLLNELAGSLNQLGEREQAAQVMAEAARLVSLSADRRASNQGEFTPMGVPRTGSLTVKLPAPTRRLSTAAFDPASPPRATSVSEAPDYVAFPTVAATSSRVHVAAAPRSLAHRQSVAELPLPPIQSVIEPAVPAPPKPSVAPAEIFALPRVTALRPRVTLAVAPKSVGPQQALLDVNLPEMESVTPETPRKPKLMPVARADQSRAAPSDEQVKSRKAPIMVARADGAMHEGPYLERMSRGEVALVTTAPHMRLAQPSAEIIRVPAIASRTPAKQPAAPQQKREKLAAVAPRVEWVPLKYASMPPNVELLNAARSQGLAARTRLALQDRGWRKIQVGNAARVRQRSLVLYSAARVKVAHRLAAQFRCAALKVAGLKNVVVLLGRDVASRRGPSGRA